MADSHPCCNGTLEPGGQQTSGRRKRLANPYQGRSNASHTGRSKNGGSKLLRLGGTPNIIWIIADDVEYGAPAAFGGVIRTPTLEQVWLTMGLVYELPYRGYLCS